MNWFWQLSLWFLNCSESYFFCETVLKLIKDHEALLTKELMSWKHLCAFSMLIIITSECFTPYITVLYSVAWGHVMINKAHLNSRSEIQRVREIQIFNTAHKWFLFSTLFKSSLRQFTGWIFTLQTDVNIRSLCSPAFNPHWRSQGQCITPWFKDRSTASQKRC